MVPSFQQMLGKSQLQASHQIFLDTRFKNKNTMQFTNVREIYQKNERYTIYRYSAFPCGSFLPTNAWSDSVSSFTSDWATVLKR